MRYSTIVCDPPWIKADTGTRTAAENGNWEKGANTTGRASTTPYAQMSLDQIAALPVPDLAEDDAHLYLWTFGPYIPDAYALVESWGFKPSALLTWCKPPMGLGFGGAYVPTTEHLLFARRGRDVLLRRWDTTWMEISRPYARGPIHSAKPEAWLDVIEQVSPEPRLEMFARRARLGWHVWGNEVDSHVQLIQTGAESATPTTPLGEP